MLLLDTLPSHNEALDAADALAFAPQAAEEVFAYLRSRGQPRPTPLKRLERFASELDVAEILVKDEGARLGLGSFKALGGGYAVARLAREAASQALRREVGYGDSNAVIAALTFACATDGNHGRSVAEGAAAIGASSVIYVHAGVSEERAAAVARFGARIVRIEGDYDASVAAAARDAERNGWILVSDTSWPGYERIPMMVMQGYTALFAEAVAEMRAPPTHIFVQAGVGGLAAAIAACSTIAFGAERPIFVVVEPDRAACVLESARAGRPVLIPPDEPTVMAMLECREPSLVAWRVLSRAADAFMTVGEWDAIAVMNFLARPRGDDPAIVAGESGAAGIAGLMKVARDPELRSALRLDAGSRVFTINTEGATDPARYEQLVGLKPEQVAKA